MDYLNYLILAAKIIPAVFLINAVLRAIVIMLGRRYGFWHPLWDRWWPRLPWRSLWNEWLQFREWREEVFGMGGGNTAQWNSVFSSLCLQLQPGQLFIGRVRHWFGGWVQPMGLTLKRHAMLVAGSGAGKSVMLAAQLGLLTPKQPAFVNDPKGQTTATIVPAQIKKGRTVHVLDPIGITDQPGAYWNFLDEIAALNKRIGKDITTLMLDKGAEAIVEKHPHEKPFFPNSGRLLLSSAIGLVLATEPPERRNLVRVRELINHGYKEHADTPEEAMALFYTAMKNCDAFNGHVAKGGSFMLNASENGGNDVLATVREATKWLDHPQVQDISRNSTFHLTDLKGGSDWVVPVAPTTEIRGALKPWYRLLAMTTLYCFEMVPGGLKEPCFFAVDEMPSLGNIPDFETALAVMRGYGIRFMGIVQDLSNFKQAYPESWESFFGNADVVFWAGVNHAGTAEYLAKVLGKATRKEKSGGGKNKRHLLNERELMTADQISRFLAPRRNNLIVTRFGERPIRAKLAPYFTDLPVWEYAADQEHGDSRARAVFRAWYERKFVKAREDKQPPASLPLRREAMARRALQQRARQRMRMRRAS